MDIQLIALDLDGTALFDNKSISLRLIHVLEEVAAKGIYVVPVTGRQFKMLPPCLPAPWTHHAVLCNGSEVRTLPDGELLVSHYITTELMLLHLPALMALGLPVELSGNGCLHTTPEMLETILAAPINPFHRVVLDEHGIILPDLMAFLRTAPYPFDKINLPFVLPRQHGALEALIATLPFAGAWSGPNSMEVTHHEATKGQGLAAICGILGVDLANVMALGDSGNDVTMLRAAGLGIAMGNATPPAKEAADVVTRTNTEDGVAVAIEKYVLGR